MPEPNNAFFSRAVWSADLLGAALSHLVVRLLLDEDALLAAAVDDTLFKRRGRKIFGAAWQHDGAAQGRKPRCSSPVVRSFRP
ncbi:transposase [Streptomyces sp. NPDC020719]|uniref:transposase n=1 Tax=Streptomyces sp. NPDC020719 TaxID=3154896 RepID=UPI003405E36E